MDWSLVLYYIVSMETMNKKMKIDKTWTLQEPDGVVKPI